MRKLLPLILCLLLLPSPAQAAQVEGKYAALTFDGGPWGRCTQALLDGLARRDARATFFLRGERMARDPDLVARISREGHEIGLQSYDSAQLTGLSRRRIAGELADARSLVPGGCEVRFLRPPEGSCGDGARQVARVTGLSIAGWSVDPEAPGVEDAAAVARTVLRQIGDGDVVVLRDKSMRTVRAALLTVDRLRREGYRFVTLSELARIRDVRLKPGQTYRSFPKEAQKKEW